MLTGLLAPGKVSGAVALPICEGKGWPRAFQSTISAVGWSENWAWWGFSKKKPEHAMRGARLAAQQSSPAAASLGNRLCRNCLT